MNDNIFNAFFDVFKADFWREIFWSMLSYIIKKICYIEATTFIKIVFFLH